MRKIRRSEITEEEGREQFLRQSNSAIHTTKDVPTGKDPKNELKH